MSLKQEIVIVQSSIREYVGIIVVAALMALSYFMPVLDQLGAVSNPIMDTFFVSTNPEKTLGAEEDLMGSIWIVGKMQELFAGETTTYLSNIFVPYGYDFGKATGFAWVDAILALPWVWLIGYPGFYNWHVCWTLFLNALVLIFFLRRISESTVLAFALAQLAIWNPFVVQELNAGRITQVHWYLLIGMVWCVWELMQDTARTRHAIGAGMLMLASCLVYWFSAIPVAFVLVLTYIGFLWTTQNRTAFLRGLIAAIIPLVGIGVVAFRVIGPMFKGDTSLYMLMDREPMARIVGLPLQTIKPLSSKVWISAQVPWLIPALAFIVTGLLPKYRWRMLLLVLIAMTIPIGVALSIGAVQIPTGYSLLHWVFPPLVRCQWPNRMMVAPLFLTLVLVATAWRYSPILTAVRQRGTFVVAIVLVGLNLTNIPTADALKVGQFYEHKSLIQWTKKHPGGLIEVPYIASYDTYVQQIFHKRPILGGPGLHNVRPKSHQRFVGRNALLQGLEQLASGTMPFKGFERRDQLQLQKEGLRWIVIYPHMSESDLSQYGAYLAIDPVMNASDIWIFDLTQL